MLIRSRRRSFPGQSNLARQDPTQKRQGQRRYYKPWAELLEARIVLAQDLTIPNPFPHAGDLFGGRVAVVGNDIAVAASKVSVSGQPKVCAAAIVQVSD